MKWEWFTRKFIVIFFICEVLVFTGIQTFNFALRMDVIVSRVEMGIFYLLLPIITPLLLLFIKNNETITSTIEIIVHFLSGVFYFTLFIIFQINSWKSYVFSMNFVSFLWYIVVTFSTVSLIFTLGSTNIINLFLTSDHYRLNNKKHVMELGLSFLIIISCLGIIPLLKYPIFYWGIAGFVHSVYGTFVFLISDNLKINSRENKEYGNNDDLWTDVYPNSPRIRKFSSFIDKLFLIILYPASWFIWADFWTSAMHPDIYFNIFYILFFTPIMYLGYWLYRFEGKRNKISFYLIKHMFITVVLLLHFLKLNITAPFVMGYSLGFLFSRINQKKFRKRVVVILLLQIFLIAGFGLMLSKWVAPFVNVYGIYATYAFILMSTISLFSILGVYLHKKHPHTKPKVVKE